jgi:catechol 2,3-dioxygenase-like lactoylglutathione lyase family enzyme
MTEHTATTPLVNVVCVSHVGITVSDLSASVEFYTNVLGFTRLFTNENAEEGWTRIGLAVQEVQLELFSHWPGETSAEAINPYYPQNLGLPKLALTVDDVEASFDRLAAAGITPLCPVVTTVKSKFFFIHDPDGTPIQLHQFHGGEQRVTELYR